MLSLTNSILTSENFCYLDSTVFTKIESTNELFSESLKTNDISTDCNSQSIKTYENEPKLGQLHIDDSTELSLKDIIKTMSQYQLLQELSLSYSVLSDDLLTRISCDDRINLKTIKIEAYPDTKPLPRISDNTWFTLQNRSPNLNLVLTSYLSDEDDYDILLTPSMPVTHLFFSGSPSEITICRIGKNCPRLVELIVSSYNFGTIDQPLISTAKGCTKLTSISLGDCELTCSGLIEIVEICKNRLQILFIWETSLIEDTNFDVNEATLRVSSLLGRSWTPESIPPW
ncbi:F-box/LRR-repeat protein 21-like [Microplitis demolitor]|uniref:F-box/LRR-repeat protein 21-like n=1 Tax=Microplitis demolitor TaxID=69319 RepID=UPI00235B6AC9|nr:F-box/LRR-repeat protein 21-like [Microplitis demolitor]